MDYILDLVTRYPALSCVRDSLLNTADVLRNCFAAGGKLLICGNGGSAADACHIAGELCKGFVKKRPLPQDLLKGFDFAPESIRNALKARLQQGLPAVSLCGPSAFLSAVINDNGAEYMYAQGVCALAKQGDVFLGISTSGNAKNVIYAAVTARAFGLTTIALSGADGGELARISNISILVPSNETYKIQEYHLPVYHALCLELEERIFLC